MAFRDLPNEVIAEIVAHCGVSTLARFCVVSRAVRPWAQQRLYKAAVDSDALDLIKSPLDSFLMRRRRRRPIPVVLWATERGHLSTLQAYKNLFDSRYGAIPRLLDAKFLLPEAVSCQDHRATHRAAYCGVVHFAAQHGQKDVLDWLLENLKHAPPITCIPSGDVCLCPSRHLQLLRSQLGLEFPSDYPPATPLHLAIAHGHESIALMFFQRWPRQDHHYFVNTFGATAFHVLAANGARCTTLLDRLHDWLHESKQRLRDTPDYHGLTALSYACVAIPETADGADDSTAMPPSELTRDVLISRLIGLGALLEGVPRDLGIERETVPSSPEDENETVTGSDGDGEAEDEDIPAVMPLLFAVKHCFFLFAAALINQGASVTPARDEIRNALQGLEKEDTPPRRRQALQLLKEACDASLEQHAIDTVASC